MTRGRWAVVAALLAVLLSPTSAGAQEAPATQPAEKPSDNITVGGRLFFRETIESFFGQDWVGEAEVASARLEVRYRWKKRLRAVLEFELRGRVRDAYLRVKVMDDLHVRAGQFKVPFSLLEMESAWVLPTVRRGLFSDVMGDVFQVTGRRPGAQVEYACECPMLPRVRAGLWQSLDAAGDPAAARADDLFGLQAAGRLELGPDELMAGASFQYRQVQPVVAGVYEGFWAAGLDAHHARGPFRVWGEFAAGSQPLDTTPATTSTPIFVGGRLVVAWRFGGAKRGAAYVEPFASGAAVDPNLDNAKDIAWEAIGGVNAGAWDRWRLQLQVEIRRDGDESPLPIQSVAHRDAVLVQLGAKF